MADEAKKKKIVRVESAPAEAAATKGAASAGGVATSAATVPPGWKPTPEAKKQATTFRIIALVLWALAIAGELVAIFVLLKQNPINMVLLIVAIVVIGILAIGGSLLWKQANRLDPASEQDKVRFFVQNQLGAIIAIIAFLPLIIVILANKNMDGKQKAIAGTIGGVVALAAIFFGISFAPPSVEQYDTETQQVVDITGVNEVFWTKSGKVFHLCSDASAVNQESADNQIYAGTVAEAHAAGKERLTLQIEQEIEQCGFDAVEPSAEPTP